VKDILIYIDENMTTTATSFAPLQPVVERFQDLSLRAHFGISAAPNAQSSPKVSNKDENKSGAANIDHSYRY
jgi:hypothetical protein